MKHFINSIEITPRNSNEIGIQVNFRTQLDEIKMSTDTLIIPNEGKKEIENHLQNIGWQEGIPYYIEVGGKQLPYYIDMTENAIIKDKEIECKIKARFSYDNFFEQANGLTFEYLATKQTIYGRKVGYIIEPEDKVSRSLMLSISIFSLSMAIADQTRELATTTKEFAVIAISGFNTIAKAVEAGIKLAIQIAYLAVLLYQAQKLIRDLIELNFPKVRNMNTANFLELCQKGCAELGYKFKSTILEGNYKNLDLIPVLRNKSKKKFKDYFYNDLDLAFNKPYPSASDSVSTLGQLVSSLETIFNADTYVVDGVVHLERWDYRKNISQNQISVALPLQPDRSDSYSFDFSRLFKRYLISFEEDASDTNTLDNYENANAEYSIERIKEINKDLNTIKGLSQARIPFAPAITKQSENWLEKRFKELYKLIDTIAGTNYSSKKSKLGVITLTQQFFSVTKIIISDVNEKPLVNTELLNPTYLWDNFHSINSITNSLFVKRTKVPCAMTESQFIGILNNNFANIDGKICEIESIEFFDEKTKAFIDYKEQININNSNVKLIKVY